MPSFSLTQELFSTPAMRAVFSPRATLQYMLDVEAALAAAQAEVGVIPAESAAAIAACCRAELIDETSLATAAGLAGNLAIPLVKQLTVLVAAKDPVAAGFVHWGATSQDIIDTALVLQLRQALRQISEGLDAGTRTLADLARQYRDTPMIGRTWMQHALPVTFGLKAAGWLDSLLRQQQRLHEMRARLLALQLGGAAGTLASLQGQGGQVATAMAGRLGLDLPDLPWHAQRDRIAEVAAFCGLLCGSLGKMARDLSLLSQTEVGELAEPAGPGRGGSSTMPHKRNPVACAVALAAANRAPGLVASVLAGMAGENERALGGWQAEWEVIPELLQLSAASLSQLVGALQGLQVYPARMQENLGMTRGLVMAEAVSLALGRHLGKQAAHQLVEQACRQALERGLDLQQALTALPEVTKILDAAQLASLMDPANYAGQAGDFVNRVLQSWDRQKGVKHG